MLTISRRSFQSVLFIFLLIVSLVARADWRDLLKIFDSDDDSSDVASQMVGELSESDIVDGLKEALVKGTKSAVKHLGKEDGFLANPKVKIPMPESLQTVESGLRKIGQDEIADNFVETMNRAAEKAVPEATRIFANSVKKMSIEDAKNILQGEDDAATQYFRKNSEKKLKRKFLPIVQQATDQVGVTSSYKKLTDNLGMLSGLIDTESLDLDNYVTDKAMDGLFLMVAEEEKKIRENPVARTTDLLKKVFGNAL